MKKFLPTLLPLILLLVSCNNDHQVYTQPVYLAPGVGLGTIIAVVVSWHRNKSILWAIIHGFLGWLYVIYALLFLKKK